MNWVDFVILSAFVFYIFEGIRRGFIEQTLELVGFFITIFLAIASYHWFGAIIADKTGLQTSAAESMAFIITWFFYQVIFSIALRLGYPHIPSKFRNTLPNKLAGLVPAILKGIVLVSVILTVVVSLPVPAKLKSEINGSILGSQFVKNSSTVDYYTSKIIGNDLKSSLTFLTVPAQTEEIIAPNETVDLKFTTDQTTVDQVSEQKMFELVNQERVKLGFKPLIFDEKLAATGRKHNVDMFNRGYFAHENPDGLSPFDRMERDGIIFKIAGENIAYAPSVDLAHSGLMRSPGHRANILSPDYKRVGIGVIDGGSYGKMFAQEFSD